MKGGEHPMTKGEFRPALFSVVVWLHIMAVYALWYGYVHGYSMQAWVWAVALYTLRSIGVSLGNHRLFTHKSFKCHFATEVALDFLAGLAAQGSLKTWVADHDQHHWDTEGDWDPHSPSKYSGWRGFWWAHIVWLFFEVNRPRSDFDIVSARKNTRTIALDRWINPIAVMSGFVLPWYFAGTDGLLLAGFFCVVFHLHITWCVNSVCHIYGSTDERFRRTGDTSRNNWILASVSWIGEVWHFYHHAKADSAVLGWKWYHLDLGKWILNIGEPLGIFWDIKRPPAGA